MENSRYQNGRSGGQQDETNERNQSTTAPIEVPRPNGNTTSGVQEARSFHSVSSLDSSAEMAKYFPDAPTPTLTIDSRDNQNGETQSIVINKEGPYATVPAPPIAQPQIAQPVQAPVRMPQQQQQQQQPQVVQPSGIPSYSTQIEGLSVSQTVVNDIIIDLQSKVINETQQQYHDDLSSGNFFEPLSPIYIRAPNPSIILRSDLHRLRAQLAARPQIVARHPGSIQVPSFPPPQ